MLVKQIGEKHHGTPKKLFVEWSLRLDNDGLSISGIVRPGDTQSLLNEQEFELDQLSALKLFARVVETGTITAAGRSLGLSTTAASKRLQDLEGELNVRLFNRTTRHVSPTEAGRDLYDRVLPVLSNLDRILEEAGQPGARPAGLVRVLARRSFAMLHIVPTLSSFQEAWPDISVELTLTEEVNIAPTHGVDIVVRLGQPAEKSLDWFQLAGDRRVICASPDYLAKSGIPATPNDLDDHACLGYHLDEAPAVWVMEQGSQRMDIRVIGPLLSNSGEVIRQAVLDSLGIAVLPWWMVGQDITSGRLQAFMDDWRVFPAGYGAKIFAVFPRDDMLPVKNRIFLDHLRVHAKALQL